MYILLGILSLSLIVLIILIINDYMILSKNNHDKIWRNHYDKR
jgi:hypothetical protein